MSGPQSHLVSVLLGLALGGALGAGTGVALQNRSAESAPTADAGNQPAGRARPGPPVGRATVPAGVVMSGRIVDGQTQVETDLGVYLVRGRYSLTKGQQLSLETNEYGLRVLCVRGTRNCHELAGGVF